jgi:hypothetical protein
MAVWLAKLGSWLAKPAKIILAPWWERLVETKAESQAVRAKLLEAIVGFRVADYQRQTGSGDLYRERGLAVRVIERLRPTLVATLGADLAAPTTLATIEREIELHAVALAEWIQLACLAECDVFNPHQAISVMFTDARGARSHASTSICGLQRAWPFTQILVIEAADRAKISGAAASILGEYCARTRLPAVEFQVSVMPGPGAFVNQSVDLKQLPLGWKPKGQMQQ